MKNPEPKIAAAAVKGRSIVEREELAHYRASPAHARNARTQKLENAIRRAYKDYQALLESYPIHKRAAILHGKLDHRCERYGLLDAPSLKKVRKMVYRIAEEK